VCYIKLLVRANELALALLRNAHVEGEWRFTFFFVSRDKNERNVQNAYFCDRCMKYHLKFSIFCEVKGILHFVRAFKKIAKQNIKHSYPVMEIFILIKILGQK
jgi:hypothetical protein